MSQKRLGAAAPAHKCKIGLNTHQDNVCGSFCKQRYLFSVMTLQKWESSVSISQSHEQNLGQIKRVFLVSEGLAGACGYVYPQHLRANCEALPRLVVDGWGWDDSAV